MKKKLNTDMITKELSTGSDFFKHPTLLPGQTEITENIEKDTEIKNQGTKQAMNQASNEPMKEESKQSSNIEINLPTYKATKKELEEGRYIGTNLEILSLQNSAIRILNILREEKGLKPLTKKTIFRDALHDYLNKEFSKL